MAFDFDNPGHLKEDGAAAFDFLKKQGLRHDGELSAGEQPIPPMPHTGGRPEEGSEPPREFISPFIRASQEGLQEPEALTPSEEDKVEVSNNTVISGIGTQHFLERASSLNFTDPKEAAAEDPKIGTAVTADQAAAPMDTSALRDQSDIPAYISPGTQDSISAPATEPAPAYPSNTAQDFAENTAEIASKPDFTPLEQLTSEERLEAEPAAAPQMPSPLPDRQETPSAAESAYLASHLLERETVTPEQAPASTAFDYAQTQSDTASALFSAAQTAPASLVPSQGQEPLAEEVSGISESQAPMPDAYQDQEEESCSADSPFDAPAAPAAREALSPNDAASPKTSCTYAAFMDNAALQSNETPAGSAQQSAPEAHAFRDTDPLFADLPAINTAGQSSGTLEEYAPSQEEISKTAADFDHDDNAAKTPAPSSALYADTAYSKTYAQDEQTPAAPAAAAAASSAASAAESFRTPVGNSASGYVPGFEINYQSQSPNYDELVKDRLSRHNDLNLAAFNDKESLSAKLNVMLSLRQLIASFFANTTLSVFAPSTASRFGPGTPSLAPIPFFFVGLIAGTLTAFISSLTSFELAGGLCLILIVLMNGLTSFRGISSLISVFSQRRSDAVIEAAGVIFPTIIFTLIINANFLLNEPFEVAVGLAIAFSMASAFATTLYLDVPQDPVDSSGTMTLKGCVLTLALALIPAFVILNVLYAVSIIGVALLVRVLLGQYLISHRQNASRLYITGARNIIAQAIMFDFLFLGRQGNITNDCFYSAVSALLSGS